jgi:hypothetical protein
VAFHPESSSLLVRIACDRALLPTSGITISALSGDRVMMSYADRKKERVVLMRHIDHA